MYHKKKKGLGMKGMNKGGKVKGLLEGLEEMPDSKGRKLPKKLPIIGRDRFDSSENLSKYYQKDIQNLVDEFQKNLRYLTTGKKMPGGGKMPMKMPGGGKMHMKMPGGGKMPMYMSGGKVYKDGGSLMAALLKDPKQRARAKKIMGM